MNNNRIWVLGALLLSVVVLAGGWLAGIAPALAQQDVAVSDRAVVESQNVTYGATLESLRTRFESFDEVKAELADARKSIPSSASISRFVGGLNLLEAGTGAVVTNIDVKDAMPFAPIASDTGAPVAEPADTASTGETADAAAPAASTVTPTAAVTPAIEGSDLVTSANTVVIPITVSISGDLAQTEAFLGALQGGERLFLVTGLTTSSAETDDGAFRSDIEGYIYVVLTADAAAAAAADQTAATAAAG